MGRNTNPLRSLGFQQEFFWVPKNIKVLVHKIWNPTSSQFNSTGLSSVLLGLSNSDNKAVIALYYSTICTNECKKQRLWETLVLVPPLHILGRLSCPPCPQRSTPMNMEANSLSCVSVPPSYRRYHILRPGYSKKKFPGQENFKISGHFKSAINVT